jgi:hypothetical protein
MMKVKKMLSQVRGDEEESGSSVEKKKKHFVWRYLCPKTTQTQTRDRLQSILFGKGKEGQRQYPKGKNVFLHLAKEIDGGVLAGGVVA